MCPTVSNPWHHATRHQAFNLQIQQQKAAAHIIPISSVTWREYGVSCMCERKQEFLPVNSTAALEAIPGLSTWAHQQSLPGCTYWDLTVYLADGQTGLAEDVRVDLINRAAPRQRVQLLVFRNGMSEGDAFCTKTMASWAEGLKRT